SSCSAKTAVFDCDGTLWPGDAGADFLLWEVEHEVVSPAVAAKALKQFLAYSRGEIGEREFWGEMVTMHQGMCWKKVSDAGRAFFAENTGTQFYDTMRAVVTALQERGCAIWLVSASNEWVIRAAAESLGIGENHVLAARTRT